MTPRAAIRLTLPAFLVFASVCIVPFAQAQKDRTIPLHAEAIVSNVVQEKGHTFVGKGSWINETHKTFKPGSSDLDLDYIPDTPKPTDPAAAKKWERQVLEKWKEAQRDLVTRIKSQYPPDKARQMLEKMNVYPPRELIDDVKDGAEALDRFKKMNSVPNLAAVDDIATGAVNGVDAIDPNRLKNVTEGLYGPDASRWIHQDNLSPENGRVFYKDPKTGRAMSSRFVDPGSLDGNGVKFTAKGSANVSSQFIDKIFDDLRSGDPRKATKQLDRLKKELQILKNKSGVNIDISDIDDALKAGDIGKAKDILAGAKLRCEMIRQGGGKLSILEEMLEKGGKASAKLMDALSKVPVDKIVTVVNGLFITFQAIQMGADLSKGDYAKALVNLGLAVSPAAIAILGTLTNEMLEAAKELGFNLVAGRQECMDMLSGIYPDNPVKADTKGGDDINMGVLLLRYAACEEDKLAAKIREHAKESSDKPNVVAINEAKCLNSIIPAWQEARAQNGEQFKSLASAIGISVAAKVVEERKPNEGADDLTIFQNLRDEFMQRAGEADRAAGDVSQYVAAFQNAIGAKDAPPCKNPSVAYFYRMAKNSFEDYSRAVSRMAELEYRMQIRMTALRQGVKAPKDPIEPPAPGKTVRASVVYSGNSFQSAKPQLDGYARMVCGEGGYTFVRVLWYLDGNELSTTGLESVDIEEVEAGPHNIECLLMMHPYGPKDASLEGLGYKAEIIGGTRITFPELPPDESDKQAAARKAAIDNIETVQLPQIVAALSEKIERTSSLGEQVMACTEQLRAHGCDLNDVEKLGEDIAQNGVDPTTVNDGLREICGDGRDNNGNGLIDEDCSGGGTVVITVWDSGSLADDSFSLSVTGYGNLGSTPAGGQRIYSINLPPGSYTATLTCILAPDNAGTYTISFSGSASGSGGTGSFPYAGSSATFDFIVQ
ncbi:MAG: hypothetical protein HY962_09635 [Ignavibacteriae bacterium]|nr:hypothetical protein [Ignavibacteriota bacterium]